MNGEYNFIMTSLTLFETPYTSFELYSPHEYSKMVSKDFECIDPKCINFQKLGEIQK